MKEEYIDSVIWKYLYGESTEEEDRTLLEWVEKSPENLRYFNDIRVLSRFEPTGKSQQGNPITILARLRRKRRTYFLSGIVAAAAFVSLFFIAKAFYSRDLIRYDNHATQERLVKLPDETEVLLGENSSLSFHESRFMKKRDVKLNGMADFVVSKDASHPFRVQTPSLEIRVLGTVFNVRDYASESYSEATLAEGAIALKTNSGGDSYQITVGQHLIYDEKSKTVKIDESPVEDILLRRYGITMMKGMTVREIAECISKDFNIQIDLPETIAEDTRCFTLSYKKDASPDQVLMLLKTVSGYELRYNTN